VVADVRKLYNGEDRYFLTGWEAGGHTVWSMLFKHPKPSAPSRLRPQLRRPLSRFRLLQRARAARICPSPCFKWPRGARSPGQFVYLQSQEAMKVAREHGFRNVSEKVVADKPHGPLADEVGH